jgi:hypothetical protein
VWVETGDARQQGDATATVLLGQKADEEPAITLVDSGDDAVEGAMFGGGAAPGVLAAGGTLADVDRQGLMARTHRPYLPLEGHRSGKVIITTNRASYFCTAPYWPPVMLQFFKKARCATNRHLKICAIWVIWGRIFCVVLLHQTK